MNEKQTVRDFYDQETNDYIKQYQENFPGYPANAIRINMVAKRLKEEGVKTIFDVGCGTCGPMIKLLNEGFDVYGVDFSEKMVTEGKIELAKNGFDADRISVADIEQPIDPKHTGKYDAAIAFGVFPHIENEKEALTHIKDTLKDKGLTFIEFRNELFSLFTFNQYSLDMLLRMVKYNELPKDIKSDVYDFFATRCSVKHNKKTDEDKIAYTDILAKFHNPLTIGKSLFEPLEFGMRLNMFYHYHFIPPMFKDQYKSFFDMSMQIEDPYDWRGNFMASAFVVEAVANQ